MLFSGLRNCLTVVVGIWVSYACTSSIKYPEDHDVVRLIYIHLPRLTLPAVTSNVIREIIKYNCIIRDHSKYNNVYQDLNNVPIIWRLLLEDLLFQYLYFILLNKWIHSHVCIPLKLNGKTSSYLIEVNLNWSHFKQYLFLDIVIGRHFFRDIWLC